ncbi:MAG: hypothetical protein K6U89_00935 [Chloroflexi bacterium]|nr:hypothetical protein [Chloroflexota bacterium]
MATLPRERHATAPAERALFRYLLAAAHRPQWDWTAYTPARNEAANFGLRFQIAFQGAALAALGERWPAYRHPTANALAALIERFLQPPVWRYWVAAGARRDPVAPHNVQYSGHLGQLIGLYERFADDGRFDRPFLLDDGAGNRYQHDHASVVAALTQQMATNRSHGVTCEPATIYVACNTHAVLTLLLFDAAHQSDHQPLIEQWNRWVGARMLRRQGGLFQVAYREDRDWVIPLNFRIIDAWSMAFLSPVAPSLFERLYPRFREELRWQEGLAFLPVRWPNATFEIADTPLASAFAFVAAREAGDEEAATALRRYAEARLGLAATAAGMACWQAQRPLLVSALFALGEALRPGDLRRWGTPRPSGFFERPQLLEVSGAEVTRAEWEDDALVVELVGAGEVSLEARGVRGMPLVSPGQLQAVVPTAQGQRLQLLSPGLTEVRWPTGA